MYCKFLKRIKKVCTLLKLKKRTILVIIELYNKNILNSVTEPEQAFVPKEELISFIVYNQESQRRVE